MMDAYLKEIGDISTQFTFPSLPDGALSVKTSTAYQEYSLIRKGRRKYPSGIDSHAFSWKGVFWGEARAELSSFNRVWQDPMSCVNKLAEWQSEGTPLNLIVSGGGINQDVTISEFNWDLEGGYGDIKYDIAFDMYEDLRIYSTAEAGVYQSLNSKGRSGGKKKPKKYTIKKGDTLAKIAKKIYGKTAKWRAIYSTNKKVLNKAAKSHGLKSCGKGKYIYAGTVISLP